jgi:hypothetical protein
MVGKVQKPSNPENYKLVSSPFVKFDTIIKIAVRYTAKKKNNHMPLNMRSSIVHIPWPPSFSPSTLSMPGYSLWTSVDNCGRCTLFHKLTKHKHMS